MDKILVSACLAGQRVRYDGSARRSGDRLFARWLAEGRLLACCPEVRGGLPVPRPPAEIVGGLGGDVLDGHAQVLTHAGADVTRHFIAGARYALEQARAHGVRLAILKQGSPSCGSLRVYDGTFGGRTVPGEGVTAALLEREGVRVFDEDSVLAAAAYLAELAG